MPILVLNGSETHIVTGIGEYLCLFIANLNDTPKVYSDTNNIRLLDILFAPSYVEIPLRKGKNGYYFARNVIRWRCKTTPKFSLVILKVVAPIKMKKLSFVLSKQEVTFTSQQCI